MVQALRSGTDCPAWAQLQDLSKTLLATPTRDLYGQDPERFAHCCVEAVGLALDFSRQRIDARVINAFASLADQLSMRAHIEAMFRGDIINTTEHRAVLHTALRRASDTSLLVGNEDIGVLVHSERERMLRFAEDVRGGVIRSSGDRPFNLVVSIGIGGSDLGPAMAVEALKQYTAASPRVAFASNVDGCQLTDLLEHADPQRTLFIVCSKTFTTLETQSNAHIARAWILRHLGEKALPQHFAAVSTNQSAMDEFGVHPQYRFAMWVWVGVIFCLWCWL